MNLDQGGDSETRFAEYVARLGSVIGHAEQMRPLRDFFCTGLMLPGERKSVEPMAAAYGSSETSAQHQSLLHFVGVADWSGRGRARQGARDGAAGDREERADRGVDHRRHLVPQAGQAFGRGAPPILRSAWQAGQLPGGGVAIDRQSRGEPSGGVSTLPAEAWTKDQCAAEEGRRGAEKSSSRPSRRSR